MSELPTLKHRAPSGKSTTPSTVTAETITADTITTDTNPKHNADNDSIHFSILDIIRMLLGISLLFFITSQLTTSTWFFKYNGKLLQPHYLHYCLLGKHQILTDSQLALYNGTDETIPVYIAVNGTVWDVSSNRLTYGPKGSYSFFAGKDCARAFATNCLNHLNWDLRDITPEERRRLNGWIEWFDDKYFRVGEVIHEEIEGLPLSRKDCQGKGHHSAS